ncbi:MAG: CAP domain-containing protein [Deltaproteobacteria bacterium]|nr:CAP domain-containing protein [Deltaproteobacteria bacterium]
MTWHSPGRGVLVVVALAGCAPAAGDGGGGGGGNPSGSSTGGAASSGGGGSSGTAVPPCAEWTFTGAVAGWSLDHDLALAPVQPAAGVALQAAGFDPFMSVPTQLIAADCPTVEVDVALSPDVITTQAQLFFARAGDGWFSEALSSWFAVQADGTRHTYRIPMNAHASWTGSVQQLRLDPFDSSGRLVLYAVRVLRAAGGSLSSSSSSSTGGGSSGQVVHSSSAAASSSSATPLPPHGWAALSDAEACARWQEGRAVNAASPFQAGSGGQCDPGSVTREGLDDALRRINLYRAMDGLGPVTDDASLNTLDQACALVSAWNPAGPAAHFPPSTSTCYTPEGASGAGQSNIAWGPGSPPDGIDQFMVDWGNEETYGHRRWILNPPLQPVGIGFYQGGNNYGSAMCLGVFGGGNTGPNPDWYVFPPAGPVPSAMADWEMTFSTSRYNYSGASVQVTRLSDGAELPTEFHILQGSYGQGAAALRRTGWAPQVGQAYRVVVTLVEATTISWEFHVVQCG